MTTIDQSLFSEMTRDTPAEGVVLLVDTSPSRRAALDGRLGRLGFLVVDAEPGSPPQRPSCPVDIALIQLAGDELDSFAEANELLLVDSSTEMLFFADRDGPEIAIARGLGIERIIASEDLVEWVAGAARFLVQRARARRLLLEAERNIPELPPIGAPRSPAPLPLARAEQLFREAYLRRLLAPGATREAVAQAAGVPYRTLCQMIRKLGIDFPVTRPGRRSGRA
jgi:hypothetical protein